jgi:hypothetical protein
MTVPEGTPAAPPATGGGDGVPAAPPPRPGRELVVAAAAWLLPGGGHLLLRQPWRALAFLLIVASCVAVGVALDGRLVWFGDGVTAPPAVPDDGEVESPLLVAAGSLVSVGLGPVALALRWGLDYQGDISAPGYEYGSAFLLTAGLMNLLLIFDAWDGARPAGPAAEGEEPS